MTNAPTSTDPANILLQVPLGFRQLTIKADPGGAVRCRWFTNHPQRPVVRQERFTTARDAANNIAQVLPSLAGHDFTACYQSIDAAVLRWRRGSPGFRPRSPAVRQEVTRCALAATEVAMGFAELLWWCSNQGASVTFPDPLDWLTCAMSDRAADRALGSSVTESVAIRGAALAKRLTDGAATNS